MMKRDLITSIILLALVIAALLGTSKLPIGKMSSPESGFFPVILCIFLGILSLVLLRQAIKGKNEREIPLWVSSGRWKIFSLTVAILFFFAIFFERLGYLISTFLLIAILYGAIGKRKWWMVIIVASFTTMASYLIFDILLKAQLPMGVLKR
jgi:putative tricarboxylic transport membrane protein